MKIRTRAAALLLALLLGCSALLGACGSADGGAVPPEEVLGAFLDSVRGQDAAALAPACGAKSPQTEGGKKLLELAGRVASFEASPLTADSRSSAPFQITVTQLDLSRLPAVMRAGTEAALARSVEEAAVASEVYGEDGEYRPELVESIFRGLLSGDDEAVRGCVKTVTLTALLVFADGEWTLQEPDALAASLLPSELSDPDAAAEALFADACSELTRYKKHYTVEEGALAGPKPNESRFGTTTDPQVVAALLESPEARALIGDQELCWSPDIELLDDSVINYYLDETILVITWQELTANAAGTFAEIIVADGSQLIRRVTGDDGGNPSKYKFTTTFAKESNAVLAISGDFYMFVYRDSGVEVRDRKLVQFKQDKCDTCFFDSNGDMIFVKAGAFSDREECERFIADNDIVFSLSFGPVLIDGGVDVTPDRYPFGEITDTYARAAIGQLGERHYLTMDINYRLPSPYNLATLQQATDAMMAHGCPKAYALDGGMTAHTVFNGVVINPLQNPWEKEISDALCFVSAYPEGY